MNCASVRERLPEHTLGMKGSDAAALERHLVLCAACRKEARDLQTAAASLAAALAPASPPDGLEDRVVDAVHREAGIVPRRARRRRGATLLLAAAVAMAGLGGGAVIARRQPAADPSLVATRLGDERAGIEDFIRTIEEQGANIRGMLGVLRATDGGPGGGSAVALISDAEDDRVLVVVSGLPADAGLPYRVELADGKGRFIRVGRATALDGGGGFSEGLETPVALTGFVNVLVRDRDGRVVLTGTLRDTPVSSPSASP